MAPHVKLLAFFAVMLSATSACRTMPDPHFASKGFDLQGHRGARGLLPENTIPAFLKALELGVRTLEMDAVITKDGQVVVSHEPWFSSLICSLPSGEAVPAESERDHRIYELTYEETARYDCGSRGNPRFPRQQPMPVSKPLLTDVIAAAEAYTDEHGLPPVRYNIETKSFPEGDGVYHPAPAEFAKLLYEVVAARGIRERTVIQSFDPRTLQATRRLNPAQGLSLLVSAEGHQGLAANLEFLGFTPEVYSPDFTLVDAALVEAAHARGMQVIPWTINTVEEMRRLLDLGVDGIITDYPDLGRTLLP